MFTYSCLNAHTHLIYTQTFPVISFRHIVYAAPLLQPIVIIIIVIVIYMYIYIHLSLAVLSLLADGIA